MEGWRDLQIGNVSLQGNVALAPLAGTSDLGFRILAAEQGASLVCTELISARGIRYQPDLSKIWSYLEIKPEMEGPVAIQLFGYDPEDFDYSIQTILEHPLLNQASIIDLNMGCPVPKVVKTGAGAALMQDFSLASQIIETSVKVAEKYDKPVSVKFRLGWSEDSICATEFGQLCVDHGAKSIAIHGRTRQQMYQGEARWDLIFQAAQKIKKRDVVIWGNGDIDSGDKALHILSQNIVDGIMVGRKAMGNPWLFRNIKNTLLSSSRASGVRPEAFQPGWKEIRQAMLFHLETRIQQTTELIGVREMRSQFPYYIKSQKFAASLKQMLSKASGKSEVLAILDLYEINNL